VISPYDQRVSYRGKRSALSIVIGMVVVGTAVIGGGLPAIATADDAGASSTAGADYYAEVAVAEAASGLTHAAKTPSAAPLQARSFAASGSVVAANFAAGDLMSDAVFYNGAAVTAARIQTLLDSQVGVCNPDHKPDVQRCLKSYTTASADRSADQMCSGYTGLPSERASTIIAKVGEACGINPGVLVTLLQKEQGLVTDDWPSATQYQFATGYACPDDPDVGCDPDTAGFFAQVYGAAWQFKRYANPTGTAKVFTWFPVGSVSSVRYSPTASCGSAPVAIWNKATAALYYYTPYQPNAAALKNFFGSGNACSAYGNRNFWGSYTQWFGDPIAGGLPAASRLSGSDRFGTAVAISQSAYPASKVPVSAVYIANGLNFPDALSAAPAAALGHGPMLLVTSTGVPAKVVAEIKRLKPAKIYVVGGTTVVSPGVFSTLASLQHNIVRLAGSGRYATSRSVVAAGWWNTGAPTVYLATGTNFPDALSAGAAAGRDAAPVLLVNGLATALDASTATLLTRLRTTRVNIVGGPVAMSTGIENQLRRMPGMTVTRYGGSDRFAVSANLNSTFTTAPGAYVASGLSFPDALAGAAVAGALKSPLFVSRPTCVTAGAAAGALRVSPTALYVLGGPVVMSNDIGKLAVCR
jgi:putative cell wall-binding protein